MLLSPCFSPGISSYMYICESRGKRALLLRSSVTLPLPGCPVSKTHCGVDVFRPRKVSWVPHAPSTAPAAAFGSLVQDFSEKGIVHVSVSVVNSNVSKVISQSDERRHPHPGFSSGKKEVQAHLCRLSGRGYLCSRSGQNGQMYPGDRCTSPCRIISFFRLKPLPPSDRPQSFTGQ